MTTRQIAAGLTTLAWLLAPAAHAQDDVPPGITEPFSLAPFVPLETLCSTPPGLQHSLAFVQDNRREFMEGVGFGLSRAAADSGLAYSNVLANDDAALMIEQVEALRADAVGAVVVAPIDPRSLTPSLQAIIAQGTYVGAVVPPPAVTILNAPQYLTGKTLAEAAARYVEEELGGQAKVVLLTHDSLQFLAPRFRAMRDVLGNLPGVTIVADISPTPVSEEGGYATMKTILLAQPDVDVVLGADTVVLGALRALVETGKVRPDQFLGGIDGEPDAVAALQSPDSPYKATVSLASPIFGYALGRYAADWLSGKSVPQAMDVLPSLLTPDNIAQYQADLADPAQVWNDITRRDSYLRMYGSICYDTRAGYLNFAWSSEN
ncbi:sugar ABC transporter substrate-binding protein [Devosia sp. SL43]|uniref:sugar ABC transporter substrate-binding protein n=1 Tax=Devosia sp. SL43 TaxID=2806348 RepID=UPI001F186D46|nr:sugar ABC transporter substrate-binding protein [Devosia sp. SL43]UJW86482.1 sugar ABC transporter substrate-binding protein [Devosia sp. SL43]